MPLGKAGPPDIAWLRWPGLALLCSLVVSCAPSLTRRPLVGVNSGTTTAAATSIRAILDTMAVGWNTGNLPQYLSGYAPDVVTRGYSGFIVGIDSARDVMQRGFWKTGRPTQQLHYEHLQTRFLSPDIATVTGQFVLTGGGLQDTKGWFTTIWMNTPDGWRCVHDHS